MDYKNLNIRFCIVKDPLHFSVKIACEIHSFTHLMSEYDRISEILADVSISNESTEIITILDEFKRLHDGLTYQLKIADDLLNKVSKRVKDAKGNGKELQSDEDDMIEAEEKLDYIRKEITKIQDVNKEIKLRYLEKYPATTHFRFHQFRLLVKDLLDHVVTLRDLRKEISLQMQNNLRKKILELSPQVDVQDLEGHMDIIEAAREILNGSDLLEGVEEIYRKIRDVAKKIHELNVLLFELSLMVQELDFLIAMSVVEIE